MCDQYPLSCALRDGHQGTHMQPHQLDATVTNLTSHLDDELDVTLGHHQHRRQDQQ